ncbi:MAG: D-alanine--D-alanine ligase [Rhodothalassiaceae bacterium]|nr:MAG: D-alanine--D-alanine ligase [Rhodothalassiaceae bacterium]
MADSRVVVAVFFGGRSVEHDVSVLTGLQFLAALDQSRYRGIPVYIDPDGRFWTGARLLRRSAYPLSGEPADDLRPVTLAAGLKTGGRPVLHATRRRLWREEVETIPFDVAVPALHGSFGEDGAIQGLFEFADIPYAGPRLFGAAASMDKHVTKEILRAAGLPVLPHALIARPEDHHFVEAPQVLPAVEEALGAEPFPVIVKPRRLGSSVGVARADDAEELVAAVNAVFRLDTFALVEPLVPHLVEYNVAVRREGAAHVTSAIERPLKAGENEVLSFSEKYLAGTGGRPKLDDAPLEGLAELTREINPTSLSAAQEENIRDWAKRAFRAFDLAGTARIDFLCNGETGEIWLNEVNSIPGSFAYYLWQVAPVPISFTALTHLLIEEAFALHRRERRLTDAAAGGAQIFARG